MTDITVTNFETSYTDGEIFVHNSAPALITELSNVNIRCRDQYLDDETISYYALFNYEAGDSITISEMSVSFCNYGSYGVFSLKDLNSIKD